MNRQQRRRAAARQHKRGPVGPGTARHIPSCPGAIPEDTPEWRDIAMAAAHETLPNVPGVVTIRIYEVEAGLALVTEFWSAETAAQVRALIDEQAGPDPRVTIATRE